ncbi:DMT family transporter [Lentilactobacillus buchneri]|uniref:Putative orotate transporter n=1 Tax=Lentilactobacillus buchneri subsp. silagei CD034 TaxID=1071400 RepID=J9W3G8_LENBU|nr:DMT family transporter [Lentilactobacillus buchneri]MCC6101592.1 DMT family transporter [Lactobacillus sp.]AFS01008.1 putative orotate transporter [Lentilactobacillus buchneri subsp. silagei CD034]MCT2899859.1 DMT family transporter [Lentilactobacillus buchneri]MCT3542928.1 DMT family transporter [Lentilactobacillus buchneri]MCT3544373.1 DMT family transporter [Lentilactobacillus buchneri]
MLIFMTISLVAGFLLSNQSPINADLSRLVKSPFIAGTISFIIGTLFLAILAMSMTGRLFPNGNFIQAQPAWIWLGGLLGSIYLTSNILLFPKIGAIQTTILPIMGQITMGTVTDWLGWFGSDKVAMTAWRLVGILILIVGVLVAVALPSLTNRDIRRFDANVARQDGPTRVIGWQIWAVIVGVLAAMQQAINGHLGTLLHSTSQAAFISFFIGTLLIAAVALMIDKRVPTTRELKTTQPWNWLGGILGGSFLFVTVVAVPQIGAGLTIMMGLIGQIIGSILIQQFGWWRSIKQQMVPAQALGMVLMLIGVGLIKMA